MKKNKHDLMNLPMNQELTHTNPTPSQDWDGMWALWPDGEIHVVYYCHIRQKYRFKSGVKELYSTDIPAGVKLFAPSYESAVEILSWDSGSTYTRSSDWVYKDGQKFVRSEQVNPLLLDCLPKHQWPETTPDDEEVGIGAGDGLFGTIW